MKNNNLLYEEELYKQKYLKYKQKYTELKAQIGGVITWEEFKKEKYINSYYVEEKHRNKWEEIYKYIKENHKDVFNAHLVIQNYIIRKNIKNTIEGAMEHLYTNWWLNPSNYEEDVKKEKEFSKKNLEDSNKAWEADQAAKNAQARKEGFKDAEDKRNKEAQAKGFSDFDDMMRHSFLSRNY